MSDLNSKLIAKAIIKKAHTEYEDNDITFTERPDIQIKKYGAGIEVTRAFSEQEGRFYANSRREIRNPEKLFHNILSTGHVCLMDDVSDITQNISNSVNKKVTKASEYRSENPWMKKLSLAVIVGYDLEISDYELVLPEINAKTRDAFDEIIFIMPSSALLFKMNNNTVIFFL